MLPLLAIPAAAAAAGIVYLSRLPGDYHVRRSLRIKADRQTVFDRIRDTPSWGEWSPWLMHEPDASVRFSDHPDQEGGTYSWDGKLIGAGTLTQARFQGRERIEQTLAFKRPFKSQAQVAWDLAEVEDGTEVTWSMRGGMPFLLRPMIPSMTRMIGNDYTLGLAMLRGCLEPDAERPIIRFDGIDELAPINALTIPFKGGLEDLIEAMQTGFSGLAAHITAQGSEPTGKRLAAYHKVNIKKMLFDCDIAIPTAQEVNDGGFIRKTFPGGKTFTVTLEGKYEFLELAWHAAMCHLQMHKLKVDSGRPALEVYENDVDEVADSNALRTRLRVPLR